MRPRSTHAPAQTLKQAKANYKKYGPRLSSQEVRRLERGAELFRRAEKIKDSERKKQVAIKKRREKEQKERDLRKAAGPAFKKPNASQAVLDTFVQIPPESSTKDEPATASDDDTWEDEIDDVTLLDAQLSASKACNEGPVTNSAAERALAAGKIVNDSASITWSRPNSESSNQNNSLELSKAVLDDLVNLISTQDVTLSSNDLNELASVKVNDTRASARADVHVNNIGEDMSPKPHLIRNPQHNESPVEEELSRQPSFMADLDLSTQDLCCLVD